MSVTQVASDLLAHLGINDNVDQEYVSPEGDTMSLIDNQGTVLEYNRYQIKINGGKDLWVSDLPSELGRRLVDSLPKIQRLRKEALQGLRCGYCLSDQCVAHLYGESVCGPAR